MYCIFSVHILRITFLLSTPFGHNCDLLYYIEGLNLPQLQQALVRLIDTQPTLSTQSTCTSLDQYIKDHITATKLMKSPFTEVRILTLYY